MDYKKLDAALGGMERSGRSVFHSYDRPLKAETRQSLRPSVCEQPARIRTASLWRKLAKLSDFVIGKFPVAKAPALKARGQPRVTPPKFK